MDIITGIDVVVLLLAVCMIDSESMIPFYVASITLGWLVVYMVIDRRSKRHDRWY